MARELSVEVQQIDVSTWVAGVTSLAGVAKAWIDLKTSATDLQTAKLDLAKLTSAPAKAGATSAASTAIERMIIDEEILRAFVDDILSAKRRFVGCINDERYTPADIDREQERARRCVCTHLTKIKEFNAGSLPTPELETLASSFRCDA